METFTAPKKFIDNPHFKDQKNNIVSSLVDDLLDKPIIKLISEFNRLQTCFTLQSCYGHFIYNGQNDPNNLEPLPTTDKIDKVEYRIAYIALCLENSSSGRLMAKTLEGITEIDPEYIQFCSAEWFWARQINSDALQVEPDRFKHKDKIIIEYKESLHIEKIRNEFFNRLYDILKNELKMANN